VGFAKSAERACNERLRKYIVWPERSLLEWEQQRLDLLGEDDRDVVMDLQSKGRPFISYTRTEDGASLVTEVEALRGMFPSGDMEELDVQCAGELLCDDEDNESDSDDDDDDDDDEEEAGHPIISPLDLGSNLEQGRDITMSYLDMTSSIDSQLHHQLQLQQQQVQVPTPPLTASSSTSSPGKKRLSLPLSPQSEIEIPFSWSRRTTRSMSMRMTSQAMGLDKGEKKIKDRRGNGTKRCLQLDLRGVSSSVEETYHLGMFPFVSYICEPLAAFLPLRLRR
jgi:hypothetical protein